MSRWRRPCVICLALLPGGIQGYPPAGSEARVPAPIVGSQSQWHPPVAGLTVFVYVNDIDRAVEFYGRILGFRQTVATGPIRMFEPGPSWSIGLVDAKTARGAAGRPSKDKPLTVSLVVDDIDAWYRYLLKKGVTIARPPRDSSNLNVRFFLFSDPEGYELELISYTQFGKPTGD